MLIRFSFQVFCLRVNLKFLPLFLVCLVGCNKLVQVPQPISSVTSDIVYSSDATATAAVLAMYSDMSENQSIFNSETTIYAAESADELTNVFSGLESNNFFLSNTLTAFKSSGTCLSSFWTPAYFVIYCANSVISGAQSSTGMTTAGKEEIVAEAKFIRAFCYFYLTNIFGDLPLVLSNNFNQTVLLSKSSQSVIYQQILSDLQDAEILLPGDFSFSGGQPIRANKWAATALLARVYLYQGLWQKADSAATAVINSGQFNLVSLDSVFFTNSSEAILQLQTLSTGVYANFEANTFIPTGYSSPPNYWLTSYLQAAFEPNDMRWTNWVDSLNFGIGWYYYPNKYKVGIGSPGNVGENYTLLRLAEQFLIRAEAEANLGDMTDAANDLNIIRERANLGPSTTLTPGSSLQQADSAIMHERRVEFFAEWGHRWFDLKRWGIAIQTLDTIYYKRGNIDSIQLLYPIPMSEIQTDPNLSQNVGY